jgi:hypothetical protein
MPIWECGIFLFVGGRGRVRCGRELGCMIFDPFQTTFELIRAVDYIQKLCAFSA